MLEPKAVPIRSVSFAGRPMDLTAQPCAEPAGSRNRRWTVGTLKQ